MKKTLIIKGRKFSYEEERITYDNSTPVTSHDAHEILAVTKQLFDEVGLKFYLAYGTLLGAVRDKGLIKGDEDVDIFIDNEGRLFEYLPYFQQKGYRLIRAFRGRMYSFRVNDRCYIDVYVLRPLRCSIWSFYCYSLSTMATPKKYFREYQSIDFLGIACMCPKDPERLLEFWYGKLWRTPVRGHKFYYEVRSSYYFHLLIRKLKTIVKFLLR